MDGWNRFKKYAVEHGCHNGPVSLTSLHQVYEDNKGSHYHTIVSLYKAVGTIMQQRAFEREMGCAKCIRDQNDKMSGRARNSE